MNLPATPHLRFNKTINHPVDTSLVAGFTGRDINNGTGAVIFKGGLLPGGDECLGLYNDDAEAIVEGKQVLFIITEKSVHATSWEHIEEARPHTFEDAPVYDRVTMPCIGLEHFQTWSRDEVTIE